MNKNYYVSGCGCLNASGEMDLISELSQMMRAKDTWRIWFSWAAKTKWILDGKWISNLNLDWVRSLQNGLHTNTFIAVFINGPPWTLSTAGVHNSNLMARQNIFLAYPMTRIFRANMLNAWNFCFAGQIKGLHRPHLVRGPYVVHPCCTDSLSWATPPPQEYRSLL